MNEMSWSKALSQFDWRGARRKPSSLLVATLASFLAISVGLINWLKFEGYPFFSIEIAMVCTAILAVSLCGSLLYAGIRPSLQPLADAALIALATDVVTTGWLWPIIASFVALFASVRLRGKLLEITAVFSTFLIILTFFVMDQGANVEKVARIAPTKPQQSASDRPAIIHLILDEYVGIAALPKTAYGHSDINFVSRFLHDNGFTTFDRAYSRHFYTKNAIPDILNFGSLFERELPKNGVKISPKLAYFELLRSKGYDISVFQSGYIDFCTLNEVDECYEYTSVGLGGLAQSELSSTEKALVIASNFISLSEGTNAMRRGYNNLRGIILLNFGFQIPKLTKLNLFTYPSATLSVIPRLERKVREVRPGSVILFHALLPHFPYSLDRNCKIKPPNSWLSSRSAVSLELRHRHYGEQLRCANKVIKRILSAAEDSPSKGNFLIIVHGDHGSRINDLGEPHSYTSTDRDDLISGFATLFAVRFADPDPSNSQALVSAPSLLSELASTNFKEISVSSEVSPTVWLTNEDWSPTQPVPFPKDF